MKGLLIFFAPLFLCCEASYPDVPVFVMDSLQCDAVETFGNGATCTDMDSGSPVALEDRCGRGSACSAHGVCVDDPLILGCMCSADEDCSKWSDYVNTSLGREGEERLNVVCYGGGCVYSPEQLAEDTDVGNVAGSEVDAE